MLRDNLEMLQTKVGENEIKIFLDLLYQTEMNVTIMKLLRVSDITYFTLLYFNIYFNFQINVNVNTTINLEYMYLSKWC